MRIGKEERAWQQQVRKVLQGGKAKRVQTDSNDRASILTLTKGGGKTEAFEGFCTLIVISLCYSLSTLSITVMHAPAPRYAMRKARASE